VDIHAYTVECGVKGASRITTHEYPTSHEAIMRGKRWSESNSQGSYWAVVKRPRSLGGEDIATFNLTR
jgi:hypothetical protein